MRAISILIMILSLIAGCAEPAKTEARETETRKPWEALEYKGSSDFDLMKNPGCGVSGLSREEKIERNKNIGIYYFEMSAQQVELDYKFTLAEMGCETPETTWLYGTFTPPPAKPVKVKNLPGYIAANPEGPGKATPETEDVVQKEFRAIQKVIPDFRALRGTLRVIPWEHGVNVSFMYGGTGKDGEEYRVWEVVTMLINDDGKVMHYEAWNDPIGAAKVMQKAYGGSFEGVDFEQYWDMIEKSAE